MPSHANVVRRPSKDFGGALDHYAVVVDESVVRELGMEDARGPLFLEISPSCFSGGKDGVTYQYLKEMSEDDLDGYQIAKMESSGNPGEIAGRIVEAHQRGFSILTNNCQQAAIWIATGQKTAGQVGGWAAVAGFGALILTIGVSSWRDFLRKVGERG